MNTLYIIGPPGSGKSTLMQALAPSPRIVSVLGGLPCEIHHTIVVLGTYRDAFGGTDRLSFTAIESLGSFLRCLGSTTLLLAEGARLANARAFALLEDASEHFGLVSLRCSADELARRYAQRGSYQNAHWIRGRATQSESLAALYPDALRLDAELPVSELVSRVIAYYPWLLNS